MVGDKYVKNELDLSWNLAWFVFLSLSDRPDLALVDSFCSFCSAFLD